MDHPCPDHGKKLAGKEPRPSDLPGVQIKKSADLDNACAKSQILEALLVQAVAMQIISAPEHLDDRR
jgi:hypothetical protein